jgi:excinuclease ABC subunit A
MYILDEPTTGLHFADIQRLLEVLDRLVAQGNSVVVIEHNLDVIKVSDRLIDLGPEGGDEGGRLIATGTPEEVANEPGSHTGRFLAEILPVRAKRSRTSAPRNRGRTAAGTSASNPTKSGTNGAKSNGAKPDGAAAAKPRRRTTAASR